MSGEGLKALREVSHCCLICKEMDCTCLRNRRGQCCLPTRAGSWGCGVCRPQREPWFTGTAAAVPAHPGPSPGTAPHAPTASGAAPDHLQQPNRGHVADFKFGCENHFLSCLNHMSSFAVTFYFTKKFIPAILSLIKLPWASM